MTNESFANWLGIAVRTVAYWHSRPDTVPGNTKVDRLDGPVRRARRQHPAAGGHAPQPPREAPDVLARAEHHSRPEDRGAGRPEDGRDRSFTARLLIDV